MKKDKIILFALIICSIGISMILWECKKSTPPSDVNNPGSPGPNEVWIQNSSFNPATIIVGINTTIKWTNKDRMDHTVTSLAGKFDSGKIMPGGSYSHLFSAVDTVNYKCTIHPNMNGTVVIRPIRAR